MGGRTAAKSWRSLVRVSVQRHLLPAGSPPWPSHGQIGGQNRWSGLAARPRRHAGIGAAASAGVSPRRRHQRSNSRSNQRPSPWPKSEVKPWSNPDQNRGQILMVRRRPTRLAWWSGTGRTSLTSTKDRGTASAMAPPKSARRSSGANPPPLPPAAAADNKIIRRGRWRERNLRPIGASMWSHNANSTATND